MSARFELQQKGVIIVHQKLLGETKSPFFSYLVCAVNITHHMVSLIYLHVCYLVLLPVEALHLVLFQLLSGLHILVIVTLNIKIDLLGHPTEAAHTDTLLVTARPQFPYIAL